MSLITFILIEGFSKMSGHINIFIFVRRKNVTGDNSYQVTIHYSSLSAEHWFTGIISLLVDVSTAERNGANAIYSSRPFHELLPVMNCHLLRFVAQPFLLRCQLLNVVILHRRPFILIEQTYVRCHPHLCCDLSVSGTLSKYCMSLSRKASKDGLSLHFLPVLYLLIRSFVFLLSFLFDLLGLRCSLHDSNETV